VRPKARGAGLICRTESANCHSLKFRTVDAHKKKKKKKNLFFCKKNKH